MTIETTIGVYEINGDVPSKTDGGDVNNVRVLSHRDNRFLVVSFHGMTFTVRADDLRRAVDNAVNHS